MSAEQLAIIKAIQAGESVFVNAVPGSGKTFTVLELASRTPGSYVLQLTYNKALQMEVAGKIESRGLNNIRVFTYHGFANYVYAPPGVVVRDDITLKKIIYDNKCSKTIFPSPMILVLDEAQDMTPEYFMLVQKFIRDMNFCGSILILGDAKQSIYEYKGADRRFLTLANKLYPGIREYKLNESFRCSENVAWFVNEVCRSSVKIYSKIPGPPVVMLQLYTRYPSYIKWISNYLHKLIKKKLATPGDIFILVPSVKFKRMRQGFSLQLLENMLVKLGYLCYCGNSDEKELDPDIVRGKIVFTTFHQAKGRERKCCVVWNFDNSYFSYNKSISPGELPNEQYVAITRCVKYLLLVCDITKGMLPYVNIDVFPNPRVKVYELKYHNLSEYKQPRANHEYKPYTSPTRTFAVTDLVKHISDVTLCEIFGLIDKLFITTRSVITNIDIPGVKSESNYKEDVSDLNGIAIACALEEHMIPESRCEIYRKISKKMSKKQKKQYALMLPGLPEYYLKLANLDFSISTGLTHRLKQITSYDWLSRDQVDKCINNIKIVIGGIPSNVEFEKRISKSINVPGVDQTIILNGRLDFITARGIYELKCVTEFKIDHKLQLLIYYFICDSWAYKKFYLINARTQETLELVRDNSIIKKIVHLLVQDKITKQIKCSDSEFVNKHTPRGNT